jgi:hypothetical protein
MAWALDYARMLEATTVGFMIGAVFLNRGHFDLVYHWFSLATCLGAVAFVAFRQEPAAADGAAPAAATAASARPQIRRREGPATPVLAAGRPRPRWGRST